MVPFSAIPGRRHIGCVSLLLLFLNPLVGAPSAIPSFRAYEPERQQPLHQVDIERWSSLPAGLQASFGNIDTRYDRELVPLGERPSDPHTTVLVLLGKNTRWAATAWQGERVHAQLVLFTRTGATQVHVVPSALRAASGATIAAEKVRARFVRYVISDSKFFACGPYVEDTPPGLVGDILDDATRLDLPPRSTRPVWIDIEVTGDAQPGTYQGNVSVRSEGAAPLLFDIELEVLPLRLPPPSKWEFQLDLWHNPWAVARYHNVVPWSAEHVLLLKPLLRLLAEAGQKEVTTTVVHHPWNAQTYDPYPSMVEWIRQRDGSWRWDYSVFDRYVNLCAEVGIDRRISCYSMVAFRTNAFRYFDEATGTHQYVVAEPGTDAYRAHWTPFLKDFSRHLASKGLLDRTAIAMDERPADLMREVIDIIETAAPGLKINLAAGHWNPEFNSKIHSYSVGLKYYVRSDVPRQRTAQGLISTFYTACPEPQPNNYPHSAPADSAWMGWFASAEGLSGFLRWAYNSWVEDPMTDARYVRWNSGECYLVYPGARSSIRFERLREGIQDFEKLRIVRERLSALPAGTAPAALLGDLDAALKEFTYERAQKEPTARTVANAQAALLRASRWIAERRWD